MGMGPKIDRQTDRQGKSAVLRDVDKSILYNQRGRIAPALAPQV